MTLFGRPYGDGRSILPKAGSDHLVLLVPVDEAPSLCRALHCDRVDAAPIPAAAQGKGRGGRGPGTPSLPASAPGMRAPSGFLNPGRGPSPATATSATQAQAASARSRGTKFMATVTTAPVAASSSKRSSSSGSGGGGGSGAGDSGSSGTKAPMGPLAAAGPHCLLALLTTRSHPMEVRVSAGRWRQVTAAAGRAGELSTHGGRMVALPVASLVTPKALPS